MTIDAKRASASLRISSQILSAQEVTRTMKLLPTSTYEKGDLVSPKSKDPSYRNNSMWILESGQSGDATLDDHVAAVCRIIGPRVNVLKDLQKDCSIDIFCGFFSDSGQAGFALSKDTIRRIAELELDLIFDVYPGG